MRLLRQGPVSVMQENRIAQRLAGVAPFHVMELLARARALEAQGRHIVHMEIGEPDFPTPKHIIEAGKAALDAGHTKYGPTPGIPELRESVARYVSRTRGIPVKMEEVSIVPGGKPTMYFTMTALLEPGDEVIYPNPSFPIYESMINFLGAKAVPIPLSDKNGFAFDLNRFKDSLTPKTKMVILNSPANPTGGIQSEQEVREIAKMLADRDVMVLSDEIYSRIVYSGTPFSIASCEGMKEKTIILDGWSKTWSMTGWRLGFGVMPVWLQDAVFKVAVNATSCTATMNQYAALAAIEGPQDCVDEMVAKFKERRDAIVKGLNEIPGFRCTLPDGAFYAFPNVEGTRSEERRVGKECRSRWSPYH